MLPVGSQWLNIAAFSMEAAWRGKKIEDVYAKWDRKAKASEPRLQFAPTQNGLKLVVAIPHIAL